MMGKMMIAILLAVFSALFYLIMQTSSIWHKIITILIALFLISGCLFSYFIDRHQAYYGNSIFEHQVLPFGLQIVNSWNQDLDCMIYNLGRFGEVYTDERYITIQADPQTPNQHICMQTILSYGYNENEIIVHWLGCDSCEYYEKITSPQWLFISPSQLITKDQIKEKDYTWISLVKVIWLRNENDLIK